jgi:Mn-dependent DtxR family transcriptional regulator
MRINAQRIEIIRQFERGKRVTDIAEDLGVKKPEVSRTLKRYRELGTYEDRPRNGRPRTARTPEKIRRIRDKIRRQPKRSKRKLAKQERIGRESVRRIVKNDIGYSYKFQEAQHLDENKKRIRKQRLV